MTVQLTEKQKKNGWQIVKFAEIAKNVSKRVDPTTKNPERAMAYRSRAHGIGMSVGLMKLKSIAERTKKNIGHKIA